MYIGIVGLGHLGKIHLKLLQEIPEFNVRAIFDINASLNAEYSEQYNLPVSHSYADLLARVNAVCIVTPTPSHYELAAQAIKAGKHVFIEKPSTDSADSTKRLIVLAREAGVIVQVGHVERFNPAFMAVKDKIDNPLFYEIHRLAPYNKRGTDVSVVLDVMIHDLDLVLSTVKSNVKKINASGATVVSGSADIANARIEFENGAVANITANRIALRNERKFRVFQKNNCINIDLLNKSADITSVTKFNKGKGIVIDTGQTEGKFELIHLQPVVIPGNAIKMELECFYNSITRNEPIAVSLNDAHNALNLAEEINKLISI